MSKNESLGRNNESVESGAVQTLKSSLSENLGKMPEKERKLVKEIMTTMSVVRESFINNMEGGYDGLDLLDAGNSKSINALLNTVQGNMRLINSNKSISELFNAEFKNFRSNILNRDLKNKNKVLLNDLKSLDKITLMFTSTVALEATRKNIKPKEVKKDDVVEAKKLKVEAKEAKETKLEHKNLKSVLLALDPNAENISVGTDRLNRSQEMRFVYSSDKYESVDRYNGDQILLVALLKDLSGGLSTKNLVGDYFNNMTQKDLLNISDSDVVKLINIFQKVHGLKVDGKFGPETYYVLVNSAEGYGYNVIDRSEQIKKSDEHSKDDRYKEIRSGKKYSEKRRSKRKKKVNPFDSAKRAVGGSVEKSKEWIEKDAEYNEQMYNLLQKDVSKMNLSELKDIIIERAVHHGGNMEEYVSAIEPSKIQREKMFFALESGDQNFQTEALLKVLKPASPKEEKSSTFAEKAGEVFDNVVSRFQEGQKETKEEKSPVENENKGNGHPGPGGPTR